MSRVCPECGREYFGQTVKCIHCNIPLVEKSGSPTTQQTRGKTAQQTRQMAEQINYQRVQQARAEPERRRQEQEEPIEEVQIEPIPIKNSTLGILALVFSVLGCLSPVGIVLAIIDLCRKDEMKKTCSGVALGIASAWIVLLVFFGMMPDSSTRGEISNQRNTTTQSSGKDTFGLLETAEMNDVQVRMTDYKESYGSEWNSPDDGKVFVLVEFEISNNSDSEVAVSSTLSFDAYVDGYSTNLSISALMEKDGEQLDGSIAPGMKMLGCIGYEVPEDWENIEIHFSDSVWSSNQFKFQISKTDTSAAISKQLSTYKDFDRLEFYLTGRK